MTSLKKITYLSKLIGICCIAFFISNCGCEQDCASFDNFRVCDTAPSSDGCSTNMAVLAQDADFISASVEITDGNPEDRMTLTLFGFQNGNLVKIQDFSKALSEFDGADGDEKKVRATVSFPRTAGTLLPVAEYQFQMELTQETMPLSATQNFRVE